MNPEIGTSEAPATRARSRPPLGARPPALRVLGTGLIAASVVLAACLILAPVSWVFVPAVASSITGAWLLNRVRAIAARGQVSELSGEPWGIDAWVVLVTGGGVLALSALSLALAWPAGWILAGLLGLLGVRVLVR